VICTKNQTEGDIRKEEQLKAADILGYTKIIFLDLPDRYLPEHANELSQKLSDVFREIKPDTVFTFDTEKEGPVYHHRDHEEAGRITEEDSKAQNIKHIYFFHTSAPDTLVDISDIINKKLEALDAHQSQAHILFGFNFRDTQLRRMLSSYGKIIGVDYAEPFRKGW
jgi:LmbE family N-acetylglucosaminyl deacetylase